MPVIGLSARVMKPALLSYSAIRLELLNELRKEVVRPMLNDFRDTTKGWEHKVTWENTISLGGANGNHVLVIVATTDDIYRWVNDGVKVERDIVPKNEAFKIDNKGTVRYKPMVHKKFKRLFGQASEPQKAERYDDSGFVRGVIHWKGIKARAWDRAIKRKWDILFPQALERALRRAAQKSGHAI